MKMPEVVVVRGPLTADMALKIKNSFTYILASYPKEVLKHSRWPRLEPFEPAGDEWRRAKLVMLGNTLPSSRVLTWMGDTWNAAMNGRDAFEDTKTYLPKSLPHQLWLWDGDLRLGNGYEELFQLDVPCFVAGVWIGQVIGLKQTDDMSDAITSLRDGFIPHDMLSGRTGLRVVYLFHPLDPSTDPWPRIRFLPTVFELDTCTSLHAEVLAALAFLELPFVNMENVCLSRPERRRLLKAKRPEPSIQTITLRRRLESDREDTGEHEAREWSCQWLVTGHWRKQWYPKLKEHRPVRIEPYMKGPPDKPFKVSRPKVYAVKR